MSSKDKKGCDSDAKSDYIYECERNYEEPREETLSRYEKRIKELETIEQDLEVLKIIIKKKVNVLELKILQFGVWDNDMFLYLYNLNRCDEYKLTLEEILKLRQWWEVNKNV